MWSTEVTRKTNATKDQIWECWTNVQHWNFWDKDVLSAKLYGPFQKGTKGVLKPVAGPKTSFEITELSNKLSFTNSSRLPLCKIDFIHRMSEDKDGLYITHKVVMKGFMTFLFSRVIGRSIETSLPETVERLAMQAASLKDSAK